MQAGYENGAIGNLGITVVHIWFWTKIDGKSILYSNYIFKKYDKKTNEF